MNRKREKHGMTKTPEFYIWSSMRQRCNNPNNKNYIHYGVRGIKVCRRWDDSFKKFYKDMGCRPSSKHTIERLNVHKGYSPNNCKWATMKVQQNNRRNNNRLVIDGINNTIAQWSEKSGVDSRTIGHRLKMGWSPEESIKKETRIVYKYCLHCGSSFHAKRRQLYCDIKCHNDAAYIRTKEKWAFS